MRCSSPEERSERVGHELGKSGEVGSGVNTYTSSGRGRLSGIKILLSSKSQRRA